METTLERLGSTPSLEEWRLSHGKQLLYQGAEVMPEEHKPEELLCTESKKVERNFVGFYAILPFEILR